MHLSLTLLLCVFLIPCSLAIFGIGTLQSAAATGKLTCNGKPYKNARIKFYEHNVAPLRDTLLMEMFSDEEGSFKVQGNKTELGAIKPKVEILHNCNDEDVECWRKVVAFVPADHISEGEVPEKVFDIGTLNLDAKLSGESRSCVN